MCLKTLQVTTLQVTVRQHLYMELTSFFFFMEGIIAPIGADVGATDTEAVCMVATITEQDEKECKFALKGLSSCQASFSCTAHSGTYRETQMCCYIRNQTWAEMLVFSAC